MDTKIPVDAGVKVYRSIFPAVRGHGGVRGLLALSLALFEQSKVIPLRSSRSTPDRSLGTRWCFQAGGISVCSRTGCSKNCLLTQST
jgi:hypothetical protein